MTAITTTIKTLWERLTGSAGSRVLLVALFLVSLVLVAAHPSMLGRIPNTDDGLLHLYRLIGLDHAMRHGDFWPRYLPGMAYGYGVPVFNYYAPTALYPFELLHWLGLTFTDSLLWGMVLYTLLGAAGAYLLGKTWRGPLMGLATAAAYVYAPYTVFNWPRRGAIAEYLGMALLAWVLWAFWRLSRRGRRLDFLLAAGFYALLVLTHNITALIATALLIPYCLILWWSSPDPRRAFIRLILAGAVGVGLAGFFWLPAILETKYVHIERLTEVVYYLDYRAHFLTLQKIFAPPPPADLTLFNPPPHRSLGLPQVVLALGAGITLVRTRRARSDVEMPLIWWALASLVILVFLMLQVSLFIWDSLPFMSFVQFPWRMLGPASVLLALLAGLGITLIAERMRSPWVRAAWIGSCFAVVILYSMPWLYVHYVDPRPAATIVDAQNFERTAGEIGGTAEGEYVPVWTTIDPNPDRLIGLYAQSEVIPRLQPNPDVRIGEAEWGATSALLEVDARSDTALIFDWLYFPGFWARVDEDLVSINPTAPHGFVSIDVPQGEHRVQIGFGPTPLRRAAVIASLVTLGLVGLLLVAPVRLWRQPEDREVVDWGGLGPTLLIAALVAGGLYGAKLLVLDRVNSPIQRGRFTQGLEAGLQTPVMATIGDAFRLIGYDLQVPQVQSGSPVTLTLYWEMLVEGVTENYSSLVLVRDMDGNVVTQTLNYYAALVPTKLWEPGFYLTEEMVLELPPGTPPGIYTLEAGMYSTEAGRNLDVQDAAGSPIGVLVPLGTVEVTAPRRPVNERNLDLENPHEARLTTELELIDAAEPPARAMVGSQLPMVWYWRAARDPAADFYAALVWLDSDEREAARSAVVPLATGYPTSQWKRRDLWRGIHMLYVPGSLDGGDYTVAVQVFDAQGGAVSQPFPLGEMVVEVPPRIYELLPPVDQRTDVAWTNGIVLAGYDVESLQVEAGGGLSLTLYWQPQQPLTENLTVFVHLVDSSGHIAAQQDQIPASGARPTPGWAPGEVIADTYALYVPPGTPPGEHLVRIGWYDAVTGVRIPLPDGSEFWQLPGTVNVTSP